MKALRTIGFCVLVLAAPLAGCTTGTPGSADTGPKSAAVTTVGFGNPPVEATGVEAPQAPTDGGVSVHLASLAIGGGIIGSPTGADQCAQVHFTEDFPAGVTGISVTGVDFDPRGVFEHGGSGCAGQGQECARFTPGNLDCVVPVRQVRDMDATVNLILSGTAHCTDRVACASVRAGRSAGAEPLTAQSGVLGGPSTDSGAPSTDSSAPSP